MIITRTPFRISFFGGGTDYPAWYLKHGGAVLATTIDKYCYISCRTLPPFFEHRLRLVYSKIENVHHFKEIVHPAVRETLRFLDMNRGLEIHHDGDLPARSGMGSSSSFTVGLLHALYAMRGVLVNKHRLTLEAIHIEQEMIKEAVGSQDQASAAYGGLNHITFNTSGDIEVQPVILSSSRREELQSHLMLFYTGISRFSSDIAKTIVQNIDDKAKHLSLMRDMVQEGLSILHGNGCICKFGELLHQAWLSKRCLSDKVSSCHVDEIYETARSSGAIGGKITGAGGGGFLLFFAPPSAHERIRRALKKLLYVPFNFDTSGSQIIFYEPEREDYVNLGANSNGASCN
jgi:D-glycero-alpha-D-manno-heptose-7-phosphate kinase